MICLMICDVCSFLKFVEHKDSYFVSVCGVAFWERASVCGVVHERCCSVTNYFVIYHLFAI